MAVTTPHLAIAVLLGVAGVSAVISLMGVAAMPGMFNRLHYLAPVSVIGSAAVAIAVIVQETLNTRGIKALLVFAMLAALNPIVVHATARAAQIREHGTGVPAPPAKTGKSVKTAKTAKTVRTRRATGG